MEGGAGAASSASTDNAVLFFHKAILFRALSRNSMTTHMQGTSTDACAPLGLFSPWLIFHPPRPPQPRSVPYVHYFISRDLHSCPHSFCLPVPTPPESHQHLL